MTGRHVMAIIGMMLLATAAQGQQVEGSRIAVTPVADALRPGELTHSQLHSDERWPSIVREESDYNWTPGSLERR